MIKNSTELRRAATGGVFAGMTAGVFLTLLMTAMSAARGQDVWYGIKGAAAPFFGERAMLPGLDVPAAVAGLAIHLGISVLWAVAFALLFYHLRRGPTAVAGIGWGFVVWLGMDYVALPLVGLESMRSDEPVPRAIAFHLFYSVAMTAAFWLYERVLDTPRLHRRRAHAH